MPIEVAHGFSFALGPILTFALAITFIAAASNWRIRATTDRLPDRGSISPRR
jgi:hypothetical protein